MKKKIMFIVPTLCGGGAEKTVANLSKYLIEDYDIDIVVFKNTEIKYEYAGNLIVLSNNLRKNIFYKIYFFIKTIFLLKNMKKKNKIDYSISFLTTADIVNTLSKWKYTTNIISIRNTDSIYTNRVFNFMTKVSCKKADKIVAISKQVREDIIENYKSNSNKVYTIYNPSLKIEFNTQKSELDRTIFGDYTFINIGRLTYQKGQWHLIRAFSEVVKKYPKVKLIILGKGELNEYLNNLIISYKLENNVFLKGFVDNPYDYIKKSDCFVFTSLFEGLGNVLLESLICETPIISTDCISGPREILAPSTNFKNKVKDYAEYAEFGILVPNFDGNQYESTAPLTKEELILSDTICKVIEDKSILFNYKKKCIERANDFDILKIKEEWIRLLEGENYE